MRGGTVGRIYIRIRGAVHRTRRGAEHGCSEIAIHDRV